MQDFREEYVRRYGSGTMTIGAEIVAVLARAVGHGQTIRADFVREDAPEDADFPPPGRRPIVLERGGLVSAEVVSGEHLVPGRTIDGPAVIDASDTTIWIPAGVYARVDEFGTVVMEVSA